MLFMWTIGERASERLDLAKSMGTELQIKESQIKVAPAIVRSL